MTASAAGGSLQAATLGFTLMLTACGDKPGEVRPCDPGTRRACELDGQAGGELCTEARRWSGQCEVIPELECEPTTCEQTGLCLRRASFVANTYGIANPSLCWSGTRVGVGWSSWGHVDQAVHYFTTLTWDGYLASEPIVTTSTEGLLHGADSACAWVAPVFGVVADAYTNSPEAVRFATVSEAGELLSSEWMKDGDAIRRPPAFIATDADNDSFWVVASRTAHSATVDGVLEAASPLWFRAPGWNNDAETHVGYSWSGSEHLVVWCDEYGGGALSLSRHAADGTRVGSITELATEADDLGSAVVWTGSGYGLAWPAAVDGPMLGGVMFARLTPEAALIAEPIDVANTEGSGLSEPALVWTGTEYIVGFSSGGSPYREEVRVRRIRADGTPYPESLRVTQPGDTGVSSPGLTWADDALFVAWTDGFPEETKTHISRLTLCE